MKKHQLIGEDDVSYHVHDGKKNFLVAKKGIGKDIHERIKGLPKFAEGGMVESGNRSPASVVSEGGADVPTEPETTDSFLKRIGRHLGDSVSTGVGATGDALNRVIVDPTKYVVGELGGGLLEGISGPQGPSPASTSSDKKYSLLTPEQIAGQNSAIDSLKTRKVASDTATPAVKSGPNFYGEFQNAAKNLKNTAKEGAEVESKIANETAELQKQLYSPEIKQEIEKSIADVDARRAVAVERNQALHKAAYDNKIDPGRFWASQSTGNKVMGIIGLILGGVGGGLTGRENPALGLLTKAIDRDVEAQAKNIDSAKEMYKLNQEELKDTDSAKRMLRIQQMSMVKGQIEGVAAKYGGEKAKVAAKMFGDELTIKIEKEAQELYEKQKAGAISAVSPLAAKINTLPAALQDNAYKEIEQINKLQSGMNEVDRIFTGFGNISLADRANYFGPDKIDQQASALVGVIKPMLGEAMQEADIKRMVAPFIPGLFNNNETTRNAAAKELKAQILSRARAATPILSSRGWAPPLVDSSQVKKDLGAVKR